MGLSYNTNTAVERPYNQIYKEETEYLSSEDISRDVSSENRIFSVSISTAGSPLSFVLTSDVILTGITYDMLIYGAGVYNGSGSVAINNNTIDSSNCGNVAGSKVFLNKNTPLPNIKLKAGQRITLTATKTAGSSGDVTVYVTGYYA
jgi:hypothetical protein